MHFQIWFPGENRDARGLLQSVGLADFVDGAQEAIVKLDPMGPSGLLVNWGGQVGVFPDRQKVIPCGRYSLLMWTDSPCTPDDLKRRAMFTSYHVRLEDGNEWHVPLASELPSSMRLVDGAWNKVRKPQFDEYWRQSELWYRRLMLHELDPVSICKAEGISLQEFEQSLGDFCVFALRQNYRVTPAVVSELGLLDTSVALAIVMSAIDGMAIREVLDEIAMRVEVEAAYEKKDEPRLDTPV